VDFSAPKRQCFPTNSTIQTSFLSKTPTQVVALRLLYLLVGATEKSVNVMQKERVIQLESPDPFKEEPHFDEEWTVLSARPVVPLEQVESSKSVKRIKLATAFVAAMILGAWVALMAVHFEKSPEPLTEQTAVKTEASPAQTQATEEQSDSEKVKQDSEDPDGGDNPVTTESGDQAEVGVAPKSEVTIEKVKNSPRRSDAAAAKDVPARVSDETRAPSAETSTDRSEDYPADRARLFDRWEERRARRVSRRDRRERQRRDLRRIDEIFEGTKP
jgi:hypothetical protein